MCVVCLYETHACVYIYIHVYMREGSACEFVCFVLLASECEGKFERHCVDLNTVKMAVRYNVFILYKHKV